MSVINTATELLNRINDGSSFTLGKNNELQTLSKFGTFLQKFTDIFTSTKKINDRQAKLDEAMAKLLSSSEPLPNVTRDSLQNATTHLGKYQQTLFTIQSRLATSDAQSPFAKNVTKGFLDKYTFEDANIQREALGEISTVTNWKNSADIDKNEMNKMNKHFTEQTNNYIKSFNKSDNFPPKNSPDHNFHNQFLADCGRGTIIVNNKIFNKSPENVKNTLNNTFKNQEQLKFITSVVNQNILESANSAFMLGKLTYSDTFSEDSKHPLEECPSTPNGFPTTAGMEHFKLIGVSTGSGEVKYNIETSKDGNTAKITIDSTMKGQSTDAVEDNVVVTFPYRVTINCDLKKLNITSTDFQYSLDGNIGAKSKNTNAQAQSKNTNVQFQSNLAGIGDPLLRSRLEEIFRKTA